MELLKIISAPFMPVLMFLILIIAICTIIDYLRYSKSIYKKETNHSYLLIRIDRGMRGEYITSNFLNKVEGYKKLIFNAYIPKQNPEEKSEIDIIMLHEKGIFVIENKNYSGWIFGKEKDNKWCQSLNKNSKYFFYNPIKQNKTHIKYLKQFLIDQKDIPYVSIISFNNEAKLKKISIESQDIIICNSTELKEKMNQQTKKMLSTLSNDDIDSIYQILKEKTKVTEAEKQQHIKNIQEKYKQK